MWEKDGNIRLSVSSGGFHFMNPQEMKTRKWTESSFNYCGHFGACSNGAVTFTAKVPL